MKPTTRIAPSLRPHPEERAFHARATTSGSRARVSKDAGGPDRAATCFETHRSASAAMLLRLYVLPLKRRLTLDAFARVTPDGPGQSLKQGG
jgi:hypothetical protein